MNFATLGEPLGTPHKTLRALQGPQRPQNEAQVKNSILFLKNIEKSSSKHLLWFHWVCVSHGGKFGPMVNY